MTQPQPVEESIGGGQSASEMDLLAHLTAFLSTPSPHLLLVAGPPGIGKTSLLTALRRRLNGPWILMAYRRNLMVTTDPALSVGPNPVVSLLMIDPEGSIHSETSSGGAAPSFSLAFSPSATQALDDLAPPPVLAALERLTAQGRAFMFVDAWDRHIETTFDIHPGQGGVVEFVATTRMLRNLLSTLRLNVIFCAPSPLDPELQSLADGVVELGWEDQDGCRIRVASIPNLRWMSLGESRFGFTLIKGEFNCPPRTVAAFFPRIGPPAPDPEPIEGTQWPGSVDFAQAFGRLRDHSITAFEMPPALSQEYMDVIALPVAAHALLSGGRVMWIPSPQISPSFVCGELLRFVPRDSVSDRFRILSASGPDPALGDLKGVVLPVRMEAGEGEDLHAATAAPVPPSLSDAYQFLQQGRSDRPSLFVLSLDGLNAVASVSGMRVRPELIPFTLATYMQLPRFHGLGFGRTGDPLIQASILSMKTHLKFQHRLGRTLIFGARPETPGYMLRWMNREGRYSLLRMQ